MRIKFKTMLKKLKFKRIIKKVLRDPPQGLKIKEYTFRKLTNDEIVVLKVKLYAHDIGVLKSDKANSFGAYLISEFESAQRIMKREQERQTYEEINTKYFGEFLESKGVHLMDYYIKRTVQGYMPFYSSENDWYREYLGSQFAGKADKEYQEAICHTNA